MSTHCPNCGSAISVASIEGLRRPLLSVSPAFACPTCGSRLMVNYTHLRTNLFRVAYVVGAIALVAAIRHWNFGFALAGILIGGYILAGWVVLLRLRQVVSLAKAG